MVGTHEYTDKEKFVDGNTGLTDSEIRLIKKLSEQTEKLNRLLKGNDSDDQYGHL